MAESGGEVVGYTLCTVRRGEGSLGRLAVRPELQGQGIGAVLLEDAVAYLERAGADRVTLCTQAENVRSRRLYAHAGFREVPGTAARARVGAAVGRREGRTHERGERPPGPPASRTSC